MNSEPNQQDVSDIADQPSGIMRIQVGLTPAESKRLIAKAVKKMPEIERALKEGTIIVDKSTTSAHILDELIDESIDLSRYASGIVTPSAACLTHTDEALSTQVLVNGKPQDVAPSEGIRRSTVFMQMLEKLDEKDVFIKSANALDMDWNAGVLAATPEGGIIGRTQPVIHRRGVNLLIPVGLEKLIPTKIADATREAGIFAMDDSMGLPCDLVPVKGTVITEIEAIKILTGAEAIPISAGGVSGAEGAVTLVIKGSKEQVINAKDIIKSIKGMKNIVVPRMDCEKCSRHYTHYKKGPTTPKPCPGVWE